MMVERVSLRSDCEAIQSLRRELLGKNVYDIEREIATKRSSAGPVKHLQKGNRTPITMSALGGAKTPSDKGGGRRLASGVRTPIGGPLRPAGGKGRRSGQGFSSSKTSTTANVSRKWDPHLEEMAELTRMLRHQNNEKKPDTRAGRRPVLAAGEERVSKKSNTAMTMNRKQSPLISAATPVSNDFSLDTGLLHEGKAPTITKSGTKSTVAQSPHTCESPSDSVIYPSASSAHIFTGQIIHNSYGAIMFRSGLV